MKKNVEEVFNMCSTFVQLNRVAYILELNTCYKIGTLLTPTIFWQEKFSKSLRNLEVCVDTTLDSGLHRAFQRGILSRIKRA